MNVTGVWAIITYTFKESIRARWLLIFSIVFFLLAINVPTLVFLAARYLPPDYLSTYLTSVISLSFPFIPLLALPMGTASIVDERESGTLQYVLSNPITKSEFFLGRGIGLLLATTAVIILGFGLASAFVYQFNFGLYAELAPTMLIAGGLNIIMLAMALVISTLSKRKATATGLGIFVWFFLTVLSDIGVLSFVVNLREGAQAVVPIVLTNPIESARELAILIAGGGYASLGATGTILQYYLGDSMALVLFSSLVVWMVALFIIGFFIFRHQDLA